jgi:hypothetical protein
MPGWRMERVVGRFGKSLVAIAVLVTATAAARADAGICKFVEWSFAYVQVMEGTEAWAYSVDVSGPAWRNIPYGYHAPGALVCEACSSPSRAFGLYHFSVEATLAEASAKPEANAMERAKRLQETFGYPPLRLKPKHLEHIASREDVRVGPLSGYALLYSLVLKEQGWNDFSDRLAAGEGKLLLLHLSDGCVSFETTILN